MKTTKRNYEAPRIDIIKIESQCVLCGSSSSYTGNSTESVGTNYFSLEP